MFFLKTEASFDSAHFLKDYCGKCRNIHGHRWRVVLTIAKEELCTNRQMRGMVIDFGEVKKVLKKLCDDLDHSFIYEEGSLKEATLEALLEEGFRMIPVAYRPTAENMAKDFYDRISAEGFPVHCVEVYETPNNMASYGETA